MNIGVYDTVILLVILFAAFVGWRKGLATQIASIISIFASYLVAVRFRAPVAAKINAEPPWDTFAAMLILYLGTSFLIWLVFRQVRTSIERMKMREFDRQMGLLFGALKGIVLAGVITMFAFTLLREPQRQAIIHSQSGYYIAKFMTGANSVMPIEVQQFVEPYLRELEQGFDSFPGGYLPGDEFHVQDGYPYQPATPDWNPPPNSQSPPTYVPPPSSWPPPPGNDWQSSTPSPYQR